MSGMSVEEYILDFCALHPDGCIVQIGPNYLENDHVITPRCGNKPAYDPISDMGHHRSQVPICATHIKEMLVRHGAFTCLLYTSPSPRDS